jgi:hypothetical protein
MLDEWMRVAVPGKDLAPPTLDGDCQITGVTGLA